MAFNGLAATFRSGSPMAVVLKPTNGALRTVDLPAEFTQLTSARLYRADRLVIYGMVNGDASEVVIIDPEKGAIVDHFLCYSPEISPNGRYIAFVKFFPAHGIDSVEDHYMLYDVQLAPERNRPSGPPHPTLVGRTVFPSGVANRLNDNVELGDRPVHMMTSDGFIWNDESTAVVFADESNGADTAVVIEVADGAFTSSVIGIPKQSICSDVNSCSERLARVQFSTAPASSIDLVFRGVNGSPSNESHVLIEKNAKGQFTIRAK
jgi:hypothetical protein